MSDPIENLIRAALRNDQNKDIQQRGSIAREYLNTYIDYEARKGHEDGRTSDLAQLALNRASVETKKGFAAECLGQARLNEEAIKEGCARRVRRTNNNDPIVDLAVMNGRGQRIEGQGIQMKIVGKNADDCLAILRSAACRKYLESDENIAVADEYYDVLMGSGPDSINARIDVMRTKLGKAKAAGDTQTAQELQEQINTDTAIKRKLRKVHVTTDEARFAAQHPKLEIAKAIGKTAHKGAAAHAIQAAALVGTTNLVANLVACVKGDKTPQQAAKDAGIQTATAALFSYITTFSSVSITGAMKHSQSDYLQALGDTAFIPGLIGTACDTAQLVTQLAQGEIDVEEFIDELAEHNIGALGNMFGAAIARYLTSGMLLSSSLQIAANMVGSTIGYQLSMVVYTTLKEAALDYRISKEERLHIEEECAEAVAMITQYRKELDETSTKYMGEHLTAFNEGIAAMDAAVVSNDINGFLTANAEIQNMLGHDVQFSTQKEFDELMETDDPFVL